MTDLDWISFRAAQTYPLQDQMTGMSTDGNILPKSLLLDIRLNVPPAQGVSITDNFYLSRIQDTGNVLSFYIGYSQGGTDIQCAVCSGVPKTLGMSQPVSQRYFIIAPLQSAALSAFPWLANLSGSLCVGSTQTYTNGNVVFQYSTAKLNAMCVHLFQFNCIQGIKVQDKVYTGVVNLQQGQGILLSVQQNTNDGVTQTTITFSVDPDYLQSMYQQTTLEDVIQKYGLPVTTINGTHPDVYGNIAVSGLDCMQLSSIGNGTLVLKNTCAKPCCGDQNNQALQANIKILQQQQKILRSYFVQQANTLNYMQANLSTLMAQR